VRDYSASRELSRKIERRARPKASRGFRTTRPGGGTSRCMRLTPRVALATAEQHEVERDDQREHTAMPGAPMRSATGRLVLQAVEDSEHG